MRQKQADQRPDEKPAVQGPGQNDSSWPESGGRIPWNRKPSRNHQDRPGGKQTPAPGTQGKDIFDSERSDRESGRPVQLDGDEGQTFRPDQPGHRPRAVEPTQR